MSFNPVLPGSGLAGWKFLTRTRAAQEQVFNRTPMIQRDVAHFRATFDKIQSAEDLTNDRRTLRVVLGAFGLQDDLENRAFIRRIIAEGTENRSSIANRLADRRYQAMAQSLQHLSRASPGPAPDGLVDRIVADFQSRSFEVALGNTDQNMRLAASLQRDLPALLTRHSTDDARWFGILGNPPLRRVLETALGLPKEFGKLDIDQQVTRIKAATRQRFGVETVEALTAPDRLQALTERFLVMSQIADFAPSANRFTTALTLISAIPRRS